MINKLKQQYSKAWADFMRWLLMSETAWVDIDSMEGFNVNHKDIFIQLPFEMQLGVYLKYLDEYKIILNLGYSNYHKHYDYTICNNGEWIDARPKHAIADRNIGAMEAIEKAFQIREKQLTK